MNVTSYNTGTISIAANGTVVTSASGGPLWLSNAAVDDDLVVTVGSAEHSVAINGVTDDTHLAIDKWPHGAVTGATYRIKRNSVQRFNGATLANAVIKALADINVGGYIIPVPVGDVAPDPSAGIENQYAIRPITGETWQRLGGVWTYIGAVADSIVNFFTNTTEALADKSAYAVRFAGGAIFDKKVFITGAVALSAALTYGGVTFANSVTGTGSVVGSISPALTGTPTAPTAAAGTSTTQIANTAFVSAAVANLVASSPSALDTLNELAAALGNDANFATSVTNSLALKAPLANPSFTGTAAHVNVTASGTLAVTGATTLSSATASGQIKSTKAGGGSNAGVFVSSATAAYAINDTGASADNRLWDFLASGGGFLLRAVNDANSAASNALEISRSGSTVTGVAIPTVLTVASGTAPPAGGSTAARLLFGSTSGFGIYYGSGAPTVSAGQGSIYIRSDGSSTSTRLYSNTNGATGWTNFTSAA